MFGRALREGIEVLLVVIEQVKRARGADSEIGRKISAREWRSIMSNASAQLMIGLTRVFAPHLEAEVAGTFSDDDSPVA